jgi:hypothetical protein
MHTGLTIGEISILLCELAGLALCLLLRTSAVIETALQVGVRSLERSILVLQVAELNSTGV